MSILSICQTIAAKIKAVYAKGKTDGEKAEKDAFWDAYQQNSFRPNYQYAFSYSGWNDDTFYPKYRIDTDGSATGMFNYTHVTDIQGRLDECGVTITTHRNTDLNNFYNGATKLTRGITLDMSSATSASALCRSCVNLVSAPIKHIEGVTNWSNAFQNCLKLIDIGQENGEDFSDFGYFSASVDLSQTAINFGTPKMSLCNLSRTWQQEQSYLKFYFEENLGENLPILKISRAQYDAAQAFLDSEYLYENGSPYFDMNLVSGCGWELAVI